MLSHHARLGLRQAILAFSLCCCLGCGTRVHPVSGVVVFADGKPASELAGGFVSFRSLESKENTSAQAVIQPDGSFKVRTFKKDDGLVPGKHEIAITPPPYAGAESKILPPPALHLKHTKFATSGLELNVEKTTKNVTLTVERFRSK